MGFHYLLLTEVDTTGRALCGILTRPYHCCPFLTGKLTQASQTTARAQTEPSRLEFTSGQCKSLESKAAAVSGMAAMEQCMLPSECTPVFSRWWEHQLLEKFWVVNIFLGLLSLIL